ncbi:MAG: phosphotransferase [Gammaproteobacteria bacterium]|jgi:hypothetical protein
MSREAELTAWAHREIARLTNEPAVTVPLQSLSGDASFRRYFRARLPDNSFIVVDAPPETEDNPGFVRIADALRAGGMVTPRVLAVEFQHGFMLQEDFGDALYLQALQQDRQSPQLVNGLYRRAIDTLVTLQKNVPPDGFPPYDSALLHREMQLFPDWFCGRFLELQLSAEEQGLIQASQHFLAANALGQTQVVVHRDYHSRNLMIPDPTRYGPESVPAVIDFQDAVVGAYTYDLVSLLRDCYISWPLAQVQELARYYRQQAEDRQVIAGLDEAEFFRQFDLMGLQRNLKVMGIFARLCIRDNKPQFLADIPQTMRYFMEVAVNYAELGELVDWFRQRILPLAKERLPAGQL